MIYFWVLYTDRGDDTFNNLKDFDILDYIVFIPVVAYYKFF